MALTADLIAVLNAVPEVTEKVATNPKTNSKAIRPGKLDSDDNFTGSLGAVIVKVEETNYLNDLESSGKTAFVRVLIDCVSQAVKASNSLADEVIAALEPFRGATAGGFIDAVELLDRREDWASTEDGRATGEYVVELEISVFYIAG